MTRGREFRESDSPSLHPVICPSLYLSIFPTLPSLHISNCLSSISHSIQISTYLHIFISLSFSLPFFYLSTIPPFFQSVLSPVHLSIFLYLCLLKCQTFHSAPVLSPFTPHLHSILPSLIFLSLYFPTSPPCHRSIFLPLHPPISPLLDPTTLPPLSPVRLSIPQKPPTTFSPSHPLSSSPLYLIHLLVSWRRTSCSIRRQLPLLRSHRCSSLLV